MNNIWEIVTLTDLIKKLKETDGFSIVAITLESTPASIIKVIKKFLKTYSKKYKNITFLYYQAKLKDLGRTTLLNTNQEEYPFVYHIYNHMEDIFVTVNRANNNTIYEAFNAVEDYYKKDLEDYINNREPNKTIKKNNDTEPNREVDNILMNANSEQDEQRAEMERKTLEHQKLLEKIILFDEKKKDYNIKFLSDIQKRKKDEQKLQ